MDEDYGCEDLWDDAEEFERDELAQDHEGDDDLADSDAFEDWRDDAGEFEPEPMEDQWLDGSYEE